MKIKSLGGNPAEIQADAKDILISLKCLENKNHPPYLETPYNFTTKGPECPLCKGKEPIIAYIVRFYHGAVIKKDDKYNYFIKPGAVTTIKEAKTEVENAFKTIKSVHPEAISKDGLIMMDNVYCDCGEKMTCTFENGIELIGRMAGTYPGGEFFIEIIKY